MSVTSWVAPGVGQLTWTRLVSSHVIPRTERAFALIHRPKRSLQGLGPSSEVSWLHHESPGPCLVGGPSDLEQPRGLGSTESSGTILGVLRGCPWPGTVLPSLCLGQPAHPTASCLAFREWLLAGKRVGWHMGQLRGSRVPGRSICFTPGPEAAGVLSSSWSFPAPSGNTREMVHGMFVKPNFCLSESPALAGGQGPLESRPLGRRQGHSAPPLGKV